MSLSTTIPKYVFLWGQVVEQLCYFSRMPGAIITAETFNTVVQFDTVRGNPTRRLLDYMTCLHAPALALSTFRNKSVKDNYTDHMHCYLATLTGGYHRGKERNSWQLNCTNFKKCPDSYKVVVFVLSTVIWQWDSSIQYTIKSLNSSLHWQCLQSAFEAFLMPLILSLP